MTANKSENDDFEPSRITKLSQDVINRIAAGEVIQRPSNALKELLENSLDAKSTRIKLFLRDGGITELRIEDNGTGILKDDFGLLCERFATSKLAKFEDLYSVATYGFRGEALASISFCAQLSITSKTKEESCAYRAHFINGHMYDPDKPDADHTHIKPSMVAGMQGTQIIVKKLFYNMSLRQKALQSRWGQEYNACLRVVSCYAIHNYHCSFSVQRLSDTSANSLDLNYKSSSKKRAKDVIKTIYGGNIASYLLNIEKEHPKIKGLFIKGVISNCDFAMNVSGSASNKRRAKSKKKIFNTNQRMELVLFINNRLVESNMIKKSIMSVYEDYLAKNHHPFVYLSIMIPPNFVDVNVHPTKKEVKFLHRDEVLTLIQDVINEKLKVGNESRTFHAHSLQHFMTQSNAQMAISITPTTKKPKQEVKNVNDFETFSRNTRKQNTSDVDNSAVVSTKQERVEVFEAKENGVNLDLDDSDEATQDIDMNVMNDEHEQSASISPHAPLRRRSKRRRMSHNSDENIHNNDCNQDTTNNYDNNHVMDIREDLNDIQSNNNTHNNDEDYNTDNKRYNLRERRSSAIQRKRNYSDMMDTDEEEEDETAASNNNNSYTTKGNTKSLQPHIVTLNLNEPKKKTKAKKATRVRVDSQQSSLDYYWKAAAFNHSTKRRKLNTSKDTTQKKKDSSNENKKHNDVKHNKSNHNHKHCHNHNEQKMSEIDDESDRKPVFSRDPMAFLPKKQMQKKAIASPQCVNDLVLMITHNCDDNLKKIFENNVYVGCVDRIDHTQKHRNKDKENEMDFYIKNSFQRVIFQYEAKLYLCNIHRISRVYFFEICVQNIGRFRSIYKLVPDLSASKESDDAKAIGLPTIYDLILLALELPESDYDETIAGPKTEVAESATTTLCYPAIAKILSDYFSIDIDTEHRTIKSIPCLVDGYIPGLLYLPMFLFRLVAEIEWFTVDSEDDDEEGNSDKVVLSKQLFKQISMEVARFYQIRAPQFYLKMDKMNQDKKRQKFGGFLKEDLNNKHNLGWILQHVIFRSMNKKCTKYSFHPPKFLCNDGSIVQIACTQQLYKVFERC